MTTQPLIHWTAPRAAYTPGETIVRDVYDVGGIRIGRVSFSIGRSPGSGFAGQVYQAAASTSSLPAVVAIKALRPRSALKTWFRDALFFICYQSSYSPRLREEAVRAGLAWQVILRAAVEIEMGSAFAVAQPLGYYWDPDLACFAEVQEWVDGRPAHNEPDERLLSRLFMEETHAKNEMDRKKEFMDRLHETCLRIGAVGLARQYRWWTLVSQANVLTRTNEHKGEFCAVDCRPGLAVPFFLPFTPGHASMILDGLRRGILVHFSEVNFDALNQYLQQHPELSHLASLVLQLREDETTASQGSLCIWHTQTRFINDPEFRGQVQASALQDLLRTNQVSPHFALSVSRRPWLFILLALITWLPLAGPWLVRLIGSSAYRLHLAELLRNSAYRGRAARAWRDADLPAWAAGKRVSGGHHQLLKNNLRLYLLEKYFLAWLPQQAHRVLVDPDTLRRLVQTSLADPIRLLFDGQARRRWLEGILEIQLSREMITAERFEIYREQIREPRMQGYIRDMAFTAGLDIFSRLVYLILGIYAVNTGDPLPLGLAALGPIPPSGPVRAAYLLFQLLYDPIRARRWRQPAARMVEARAAALLIAPWRWIGNLFPLVEISTFYTRLSFLFAEFFITRAIDRIPIFGGEGKILEHYVFQICYNLPLSIRYELKRRFLFTHSQ